MKTVPLFLALSAASLAVMATVDFVIGPKAEFLNAWSVLQRLAGQAPTAGESLVARELGALGEFCVVVAANLAAGGLLTLLARVVWRA